MWHWSYEAMVRYTGSVASLLSALITTSLAKNTSVPSSLIGCEEVSCPRAYGDTDTCTVANEVFMGIGLAPVPDVPCSLTGISLIKAVNASTYGKSEFRTVYYLGTPPDLDLGGLEGCAVFFHDSAALFKPEGEDVRATRGVCRDVIEHECIDELPKQARNSVSDWNKEPSTEHPCKALRDDLWDSPVDGCGDMSGDGLGIGRIAVVSLGDLSPISKIQNESSNCWPVVPKSNDLTVLTSDTVEVGNHTLRYDTCWLGCSQRTIFRDNTRTTTSWTRCTRSRLC